MIVVSGTRSAGGVEKRFVDSAIGSAGDIGKQFHLYIDNQTMLKLSDLKLGELPTISVFVCLQMC